MRFKEIQAGGFGCLKGWRSPELTTEIVVFYGKNEAGKSALFNLIATLLYGWNPSSADKNPYVPWDGTKASGEAVLVTGDGQEAQIYRRLRSRPEGILTSGGDTLSLGNGALPQVSFLPREIFTEVYALTLDQLSSVAGTVWGRLQEQLLGGQYGSFMRSLSGTAIELESEANSLWRADRRGMPRARQIQKALADLRKRRQDAQENERSLRRTQAALEELSQELETLLAGKARIVALLGRCERILPVIKKQNRIKELMLAAGDIDEYDALPADPGQELKDLETKSGELEKERGIVAAQKVELTGQLASFTSADQFCCEREDRINLLARSYRQAEEDGREMGSLEDDIKRCQDRLHDRAQDFLQGGWRPQIAAVLQDIDQAELRAAISAYKLKHSGYREQKARAEGLQARAQSGPSRLTPWVAAGFIAMGAVCALYGARPVLGFAAALLLVTGLGLLSWFYLKDGRSLAAWEDEKKRLAEIEAACASAKLSLASALKGLPVAPALWETSEESLLVDINRLKDLLDTLREKREKKDKVAGRIKERELMAAELLQELGLNPQPQIWENINLLEARLAEARQRFSSAGEAGRRLEEVEQKLGEISASLQLTMERKNQLTGSLEKLNGDSLDEKALDLVRRRFYRQSAKALQEELEREYDPAQIQREIEQCGDQDWSCDDEKIALARTKREQLDQGLNTLNEQIGTLKNELLHGREKDRLDDIEGEMSFLEGELRKIYFQRDRLMLLKNILAEADRCFREEHQPDVLARAGRYLDLITSGRYGRLFPGEEGSRELLLVKGAGHPLVVGHPLSRGTMEQIYLSLRLALADHLDGKNERLPLFLDDVLVNWDGERMQNGLRILEDMAQKRQVFLFTCHKWLVDRLAGNIKVQVVELQV